MSGSFRYSVAVPAHGSFDLKVAVPAPTLNRRRSSTAAKGSTESSTSTTVDSIATTTAATDQQRQQVAPTVAAPTVTTVALRGMDPALKACFPVVYSPSGEDILTSGGSGEHTSVRTVELQYMYINVS
jgi:hypothetical protein